MRGRMPRDGGTVSVAAGGRGAAVSSPGWGGRGEGGRRQGLAVRPGYAEGGPSRKRETARKPGQGPASAPCDDAVCGGIA